MMPNDNNKKNVFGHQQIVINDAEPLLIVEARERNYITLISMSPDAVFIGGEGVDVENGFALPIGTPVQIHTSGEIWGIAKVHGSISTSTADHPSRTPAKSRICFIETFMDSK